METSRTSSTEEIEELAYRYWEERGCPEGESLADWLRAEQDLCGLLGQQEPPSSDLPE